MFVLNVFRMYFECVLYSELIEILYTLLSLTDNEGSTG